MVVQGVAKSFREIFGELAPGGRGELVMQKRLHSQPEPADDLDGDDPEEQPADGLSERYSGVKVKVRTAGMSSTASIRSSRSLAVSRYQRPGGLMNAAISVTKCYMVSRMIKAVVSDPNATWLDA